MNCTTSYTKIYNASLNITYDSMNLTNVYRNFEINVHYETYILFSVLALLSFVLLSISIFSFPVGDDISMSSDLNHGILCFGIFSSIVSDLSYQKIYELEFCVSSIVTVIVFGIIFTFVGAFSFFKVPRNSDDGITGTKPLGHGHLNVSLFVWVATLPLVLLEIMIMIGCAIDDEKLLTVLMASGFLQKLSQAALYHFGLRYKVPALNKNNGASLYLKILALFNFSMWLQSIMVADNHGHTYLKKVLQSGYGVFTSFYSALLIDYRLLCCMLFVEHALVIDHRLSKHHQQQEQAAELQRIESPENELIHSCQETAENFKVDTSQLAGFGYVFGFIVCAIQIVNALQYTCYLGPATNIIGIIAEISVILFGTFLVIQVVRLPDTPRRKGNVSIAVDTLIKVMGVFSIIFWCLKGFITSVWVARAKSVGEDQEQYAYLFWNAVKYSIRPFSIIFELYLFSKADAISCTRPEIKSKKGNHFLIPCIMLSFLAVFVNSVIDVYSGYIEGLVEEANLITVLRVVYKCGSPIYLGFCLHMFLYFLIINSKLTAAVFYRRRDIFRRYTPVAYNNH